MELFNTWQFNLVGFLISIILFFQFYKLAVKDAVRDGAATILLQGIAGVCILFLMPFLELKFPTEIKYYLLMFAASVFYAINDRLQTTVRKHLEVSVFSIINQLSNVFLILIGITVFREPLVATKILGAALILSGNALLFYNKQKLELNTYSLLAIASTFAFATAISIDIDISRQFNLPFYIMLTLIIPAILVMMFEKIKWKEVVLEYKSETKNYYLVTGVTWALAIFFSLRAFQFGKVTTIVPLQASSVILNVIVACILLKERDNLAKKITAAVLVVSGICVTVLG